MHQSGHSRAQSMQTVQFSSSSAMTPRLRGGSSGSTSGYCWVVDRLVIVLNVTASPLIRPWPGVVRCPSSVTSSHPAPSVNFRRAHPQEIFRYGGTRGERPRFWRPVMTAALNDLPPADGWTTDDLDALPEDGVRRELLD